MKREMLLKFITATDEAVDSSGMTIAYCCIRYPISLEIKARVNVTLGISVDRLAETQAAPTDRKYKEARWEVERLATSLHKYRLDVRSYPKPEPGLDALIHPPTDTPAWKGPYLKTETIPSDPWGRKYYYEYPGKPVSDYDIYPPVA